MAWQNNWRPKKTSNVPNANSAPWLVELPNGKKLHGCKADILKEALRRGIDRIYDRMRKQWVRLDLATGKIRRIPTGLKDDAGVAQQ